MNGFRLTFYLYEFDKHHGILLYEWLLEWGQKHGLKGGSAFRGIAGFGKSSKMHEEQFFELGANVPVQVIFVVNVEEMEKIFAALKEEKLSLFYTKQPVEYGLSK